jgi:hypothetical protein
LSWAQFALCSWSSPDFPVRSQMLSVLIPRHRWFVLFGHVRSYLFCQLRGVSRDHVLYSVQSQRVKRQLYVHC